MITLTALFFCICNIQLCLGELETGPVGFFDMQDLDSCENDVGTILNLELVKEGDEKWAQGNITIDYDLDAHTQYKAEFDRWSGTEWKYGNVMMEGKACAVVKALARNAFTKLIETLDPKPKINGCNIPKGTYTMKNFKAVASDIKVPNIAYGRYRAKLMFYNGNDLIACLKIEADAKN